MISLQSSLIVVVALAILAWLAVSCHVVLVERRRRGANHLLGHALTTLGAHGVTHLPLDARLEQVRPLVAQASRELIMRAAADRDVTDATFDVLIAVIRERWGLEGLVGDASEHRSSRDKWRRTAALRILSRCGHPHVFLLLARAADDPDTDVATSAFSILGRSSDPRAMDILFDALRSQRHPASRVAIHIERSPLLIADRLRTLLDELDPVLRLWGATLLAQYPEPAVECDLARLTDDTDPRVRKAAIQSLGRIGDELAADCAIKLLTDTFPFVRAHAARALGELGKTDLAEEVATLLGDVDWWVRRAAKESLETMGADVWPVLMRCLSHSDRFVRNGAAEVFQNVGVLDSLIVMEAASDNPGQNKIVMLRQIAEAGGVRFTDSLVERAGPIVGPRIRHLLAAIGLEHVGAA